MPFCAIKLCGNSGKNSKEQGISFHKFPNNANIRDVWINATNQGIGWLPDKNSTICSKHFAEDCYILPKKKRILEDNAVPTLNIRLDANAGQQQTNYMPNASIRSYLVQEDPTDPTSVMIRTDAVTVPVIRQKPKQTPVVPLKQTNQVVIRMEEGIGVIKEEPPDMPIYDYDNVANPTYRNDGQSTNTANPTLTIFANTVFTNEANSKVTQVTNPTAPKVAVRTPIDPNDPLAIELEAEPLEYLQSTKKKLWNNIINLKEKLKMKNKKINRLLYRNKRLTWKVNELKLLVNDLQTELYGGEVLKKQKSKAKDSDDSSSDEDDE